MYLVSLQDLEPCLIYQALYFGPKLSGFHLNMIGCCAWRVCSVQKILKIKKWYSEWYQHLRLFHKLVHGLSLSSIYIMQWNGFKHNCLIS